MPVDKSNTAVQEMFADIAPKYDRMNHLLSMNVDKYWRWRAVRLTQPVENGGPILDLCTGTGDLALAYWKKTGGKVPIVGSDFCQPMLDIAEKKKQKLGIGDEQLKFMQADTQSLPLPDNEFQIVSVAFGLRNVADTDQGLREMARVCKPGGRVAVLEFSMPRWQPFRAAYGFYFRNILPRIGQMLARNRKKAYSYLPDSVGEFPQGEALATRMKAAGLSSVRFWPMTMGVATLYLGVK